MYYLAFVKNSHKPTTPNFDAIDPRHCINAKFRKLHRLAEQAYQQEIGHFDMKGSMPSILFVVGKRPEISQRELADVLIIDTSTVSRDIKRLSRRGLIRFINCDDRRQKALMLTAEGYRFVEKLAPAWAKAQNRMLALIGELNSKRLSIMLDDLQSSDV